MQHPATDTTPRPAATLIIMRRSGDQDAGDQDEVLMQERGAHLRFAPGACVFPGGAVDDGDRALAAALPPITPGTGWDHAQDLAARMAAIRETLEETGLAIAMARQDRAAITAADADTARRLLLQEGALGPVLTRMGWNIAPEALVPFARWQRAGERPFDTRFYLADLGTGAVTLSPDGGETHRLLWITPARALAMADAGELSIIYPTQRNLERLAAHPRFDLARAHAMRTALDTITPATQQRDGEPWLVIPEGLGYPITAQKLSSARRG